MKYAVRIKEVWGNVVYVDAASEQAALEVARSADRSEDSEYLDDLSAELWDVEPHVERGDATNETTA